VVILGGLAFWFLVPLPEPAPLNTFRADHGPHPQSGLESVSFQFPRPSKDITLRVHADIEKGSLSFELLDDKDNVLFGPYPVTGGQKNSMTFSSGGGFLPDHLYRLRIAEQGVAGSYSVAVADKSGITWWQRVLALAAVSVIAAVVCRAYRGLRKRGVPIPDWCVGLEWAAFIFSIPVIYALLHEGGHTVAAASFRCVDWSGTDLIGVGGYPHAGTRPLTSLPIPSWQKAVIWIAGTMGPACLGYFLFLLWSSPMGKRARLKSAALERAWSLLIVFFMIAQLGLLLPMAGLMVDTDYTGFANNFSLGVWAANALLGFMVLVSFAVFLVLACRLWAQYSELSQRRISR